ncbi:MAG: chemotaxis protein CheW [bacterium]
MHIIRNAIDHGIELPDDRIKLNKPRIGKLSISAYHEGNNIIIVTQDDGRGLDLEAIKEKAIEKELLSPLEISRATKKELLNLIFMPGFSTAKVVTGVSGRGVGMDVVKTNIEKLKGIIEIDTEIGNGSKIIIKLPLTLAIIKALLVKVNKEIFAVPLTSVIETVRIIPSDIQTVDQFEVLRLRDIVLPLLRLKDIFDIDCKEVRTNKLYVVVVGLGEKKMGLIVDSLIGQEEVVIKSLGEYLAGTKGIAGATIMGDGQITLIIDIASLMNLASSMALKLRVIAKNNISITKTNHLINLGA